MTEYRVIAGHPVPYALTVQERVPEGEWTTMTVGALFAALRVHGPDWFGALAGDDKLVNLGALIYERTDADAHVPYRQKG